MFENTLYTQHKRRLNERNTKNKVNATAGPGTAKRVESFQRLATLHKEYASNSDLAKKVTEGLSAVSLMGAVGAEMVGMHRTAKTLLGASALFFAGRLVAGVDEFNHHVSGIAFDKAAHEEQKAMQDTGLRLVQAEAPLHDAM
jgi:hypothetical protein